MSEPVTLHTPEARSWELTRAVLVYTSASATGERHAYATVHDVLHKGREARLDAGVPATREACADLARALGATATLGGFIPPRLLYLGARSIIWWRPPWPARLFFDTTQAAAGDQPDDKSGAALIGEKNGRCPQPGLVFAVAGGNWYVYALAGDERPHPGDALLRAPYFNVWEEGRICTGNVRLPETLSTAALEAYEKAFFDSRFTHPNVHGRNKLIHHFDGPYGFWAGMLKRPLELGFPEELLVKMNLSLQGLAKKLENGRRSGE